MQTGSSGDGDDPAGITGVPMFLAPASAAARPGTTGEKDASAEKDCLQLPMSPGVCCAGEEEVSSDSEDEVASESDDQSKDAHIRRLLNANDAPEAGDMRRYKHRVSGRVHKGKAGFESKIHCGKAQVCDCELLTIQTTEDEDEKFDMCLHCFRELKVRLAV